MQKHNAIPTAVALVALGLVSVLTVGKLAGTADASPAAKAATPQVARGEYLVRTMACNDCHTPWKMGDHGPEPDMSRMLSGHPEGMAMPPAPPAQGPWLWSGAATNTAYAGPWGVSFAANLTPDQETGLGLWDEETFVQALRSGRHAGAGRPLLPPMPWPAYAQASDEDLAAIFAYLHSIPAIKNRVPQPVEPATTP